MNIKTTTYIIYNLHNIIPFCHGMRAFSNRICYACSPRRWQQFVVPYRLSGHADVRAHGIKLIRPVSMAVGNVRYSPPFSSLVVYQGFMIADVTQSQLLLLTLMYASITQPPQSPFSCKRRGKGDELRRIQWSLMKTTIVFA